jgi:CHAT domain-containing protein
VLTAELPQNPAQNPAQNPTANPTANLPPDPISDGDNLHLSAQELGAQELGAQELGAQEFGAQELGAQELGAQEFGAQELSAQEQGQRAYAESRYADALAHWQRAATEARTLGQHPQEIVALQGQALALQALGREDEADRALDVAEARLATITTPDRSPDPSPDPSPDFQGLQARLLNTRGTIALERGQPEAAIAPLQQAQQIYAQLGDRQGQLGTTVNQARALEAAGLYRRSADMLRQAAPLIAQEPDPMLRLAGWLTLADALRAVGNLAQAREVLTQALASVPESIAGPLWLSLGQVERAAARLARDRNDLPVAETALQAADRALAQAQRWERSPLGQLRAELERLDLAAERRGQPMPTADLNRLGERLATLPLTAARLETEIRLALLWRDRTLPPDLSPTGIAVGSPAERQADRRAAAQGLAAALAHAQAIGDRRTVSFARGELGQLYLAVGQRSAAQELLTTALREAQQLQAMDLAYRWQWQLGRLAVAMGDRSAARLAYPSALAMIGSLRSDLAAIDRTVQFSFRDRVEPVYREYIALLLDGTPSPEDLITARQTLEALQLAELDNFFRNACLDAQPEALDAAIDSQPTTAAIEAILLPDRVAVIVKLPGQPLRTYATAIAESAARAKIQQFVRSVQNPALPTQLRQTLAQELEQWLIAPVAPDLDRAGIDTLTFVLDGPLASIPLAALYDGQRYLIERYRLALSPSLSLFAPQPLGDRWNVLLSGIDQDAPSFQVERFDPLPFVADELAAIQAAIPSAQVLANADLTADRLQTQLTAAPATIVHIATHGQFSSNADRTFLLAWDRRIGVEEFDQVLRAASGRSPIALLVLSACETAVGDDRAVLGLAGIAIQAGARSTLATLWQVSDESTAALMAAFYRQLATGDRPKTEALRQAQLALLQDVRFAHPFFWAPYLVIGNWL